MKNTLDYYYNIRIEKLIKSDKDYYFLLNDVEYHLIKYNRPIEDITLLYKLNQEMIKKGCHVYQIILNKDKKMITIINDIPYVLLRVFKHNGKIRLIDINYMQISTYNIDIDSNLNRNNWIKLWCEKIDYYEYQINQLGKDYPILCDSLSYYIGLGENAISYLVNNVKSDKKINVVSHKRIKLEDNFDFFNPLNFIIDNRVRDVAEYIKDSFFKKQFDFLELKQYLNFCGFNSEEYTYLFSRLLFPTYYFDIYDKIINKKENEEKIISIIDKNYVYEEFLYTLYKYIVYEKKVQLEPIEWLIKSHS